MNLSFIYNEDKDVDCLLSKGPGSNNQKMKPTHVYEKLLAKGVDIRDREKVRDFVREYISENNIAVNDNIRDMRTGWQQIERRYTERAEKIFGVTVAQDFTAYLTITGRYPYNIEHKYFFVPAHKNNANSVAMHELWHFYTWNKFGNEESVLGKQKYQDGKESLTVLLNVEFADLLGGNDDKGYPQHQEMRKKMLELWQKTRDIEVVWTESVQG